MQNGPGWNMNTVTEYCEKWLLMQSVHIRATTLTDYTSKIQRHIIKELGQKRMADVTLDDIQLLNTEQSCEREYSITGHGFWMLMGKR